MIAFISLIASAVCGLLGIFLGCIIAWLVIIPAMNYSSLGFWWIPFINDNQIGKLNNKNRMKNLTSEYEEHLRSIPPYEYEKMIMGDWSKPEDDKNNR